MVDEVRRAVEELSVIETKYVNLEDSLIPVEDYITIEELEYNKDIKIQLQELRREKTRIGRILHNNLPHNVVVMVNHAGIKSVKSVGFSSYEYYRG